MVELINQESCGEPSRKASGLLALMEKFSTYYGLKLSYLVLSVTEQLSRTLQSSNNNAQEAYIAVSGAKHFLKRQRMESSFEYFITLLLKNQRNLLYHLLYQDRDAF